MNLNEAYEILELSGNASTQDIRKQYLKLVKLHHPDKGGDPKVFIKIRYIRDFEVNGFLCCC